MDEVEMMSEGVVEEKKTDSKIKPTKTVKIKKVRRRTKGLLKNILSQMEFYFSDSNLQKDRFIKHEIDKDQQGYVDLSLFLKFNKIQKMTEDLTLICKAVSKSEKLKLNEDRSKVKRVSPFVERDIADIDSRTVYVECLPRNVDHEWMKRVFSECGVVNYVSLPKFKSTGDTKGFGFIEFETRKAAEKACELLNNPPLELGARPGKFPKTNKQLEQLKKQGVVEEETEMVTEIPEQKSETILTKGKRKRHRNTSESSVDYSDSTTPKKLKQSTSEDTLVTETKDDGPRKSLDGKVEDDVSRSKKKKKKKKNRRSVEANKTDEESEFTDICHGDNKTDTVCNQGDKIESKQESESKDSKGDCKKTDGGVDKSNDSSNLKRKRLSEDNKCEEHSDSSDVSPQKRKRKMEESVDCSSESDIKSKKKSRSSVEFSDPVVQTVKLEKSQDTGPGEKKKKKRRKRKKKEIKEAETLHLRVLPKTEWLQLRKQYLNIQKTNMSTLKKKLQQIQKENKAEMLDSSKKGDNKTIEYIPGVIVHIESQIPLEKKEMREIFNEDIKIAYIDVTDGNKSGYIRCKDVYSAMMVVNSNIEYYKLDLLSGEEEENYWKKLKSDRENKLNNKQRPKKRGMQKLIDKAQKINAEVLDKKHVFFED
ncbi:la-related protein 7 [Patella vulgata]|uniref:la-related protein 7 n=1 Tax=Patella vulgata TaxID=6465 RepID=UPI0021804BE2|nr:la-related protein 7 [Patella vulgata]